MRRRSRTRVAFAIAAGPVLAWKLRDGSGLDWTLRPDWVDVYCRGLLHNICYVLDASPLVIGLTAGGAAGLALGGGALTWGGTTFAPTCRAACASSPGSSAFNRCARSGELSHLSNFARAAQLMMRSGRICSTSALPAPALESSTWTT